MPGIACEIADASDASVVEAVRRVQLDAAPLAAARVERGAAVVAQDATGLSADAHALSNAVDVHGPAATAVPLSGQHRGPQAGRAKHRDSTLAVSLRNRKLAAFQWIEYLQLDAVLLLNSAFIREMQCAARLLGSYYVWRIEKTDVRELAPFCPD